MADHVTVFCKRQGINPVNGASCSIMQQHRNYNCFLFLPTAATPRAHTHAHTRMCARYILDTIPLTRSRDLAEELTSHERDLAEENDPVRAAGANNRLCRVKDYLVAGPLVPREAVQQLARRRFPHCARGQPRINKTTHTHKCHTQTHTHT